MDHLIYGRKDSMEEMFVRVHVLPQEHRYRPLARPHASFLGFTLSIIAVVAFATAAGPTSAFFADEERATDNTLAALPLDFSITPETADITLAEGDDSAIAFSITPAPGSLPFSYDMTGSASSTFCGALTASGGSPLPYTGPLTGLSASTTSSLDPWVLTVSFPNAAGIANGDTCTLLVAFRATQDGALAGTEFHDDETATIVFHADVPEPAFIPFSADVVLPPSEDASSTPPEASSTPPIEE